MFAQRQRVSRATVGKAGVVELEQSISGEMLLLCISKTSLFSFNPDIVTHELVTLGQIIQ